MTETWHEKRREIQQDSRLYQMAEALKRAEAKERGERVSRWTWLVNLVRGGE